LRSVEYTDSDLWVKDELERLFWIEIAKRKARLVDVESFELMLALWQDVVAWFESHENEFEEPFHDGVDAFWDKIQFGSLSLPFLWPQKQLELLDEATALFARRGGEVAERLPCYRGFFLADFAVVTNLVELHGWWQFISSGRGRKYLHSKGLYSSCGEPHPVAATEEIRFVGAELPAISVGEMITTTISLSNPVRAPRRLRFEKMRTLVADERNIIVDGERLSGRMLLDFDLSKPMPSMREIEYAVRAAFNAARLKRWDAMLASGTLTDPTLLDETELRAQDMTKLLLPPIEEHKLMLAVTSARPIIVGLHCWDLVQAGLSKNGAARQAVDELRSTSGDPDLTMRRALNGLAAVQKRIDEYDSSMLPWNR